MKIELKIPTAEDKESLIEVCNAVDRQWISGRLPYPYTNESADWWINMIAENEGKTGIWRVIYVDGRLVGNISVEKKINVDAYRKDGEIGYLLLTEYWSQGIMTQAARQICRTAFEQLDIVRITGVYYEPNVGSKRVLEKVGFEYEGLKRNAVCKGDKLYNLCIMGLLRDEYLEMLSGEKNPLISDERIMSES